jgi:cyanophycinase
MTPTRVALVGGNEFRRDCDAIDRTLLELAGGARPSVAILPTAAARENPRLAGHNGVRHFKRLGARAQAVMIVDRKTANQPELVAALEHSHLIYLTGGDAVHLLDSLSRSHAWDVMLARHAQGVVLVGSSAGAMVLGGQMWGFDGWTPGLGLLPNIAVLPHHATLSARWDAPAMAASLPAGVTLVGIDEATALLLPEGRVLGVGEVTVYGSEGIRVYGEGELVRSV